MYRRRCDNAEIPETRKACSKSARYRRGAHPKRVDALRQARKFRLLRHSEVLLLVDNDEAEVSELHVLRSKRLGAHHDLQFAATQAFLRLPRFRSRRGPRQATHLDVERTE